MTRILSWMGVTVFGFLLLSGCFPRVDEEPSEGLKEPDRAVQAVEFSMPSLKGDAAELRLSDYAGKIVLLDFWATWCPPCVESLPYLQGMYEELGGENA